MQMKDPKYTLTDYNEEKQAELEERIQELADKYNVDYEVIKEQWDMENKWKK